MAPVGAERCLSLQNSLSRIKFRAKPRNGVGFVPDLREIDILGHCETKEKRKVAFSFGGGGGGVGLMKNFPFHPPPDALIFPSLPVAETINSRKCH